MMPRPRAVELNDLPAPEPNLQDVEVVRLNGRVFLFYGAWPRPDRADEPSGLALLEFRNCWQFTAGGPNDEALHNHPTFRYGVRWYTNWEILDSPWTGALHDILHKDGPSRPADARAGESRTRHFVFAFKENTFECFADGYHLHGLFTSQSAAMNALADALRRDEPWKPPRAPHDPYAHLVEKQPRAPCDEPGCTEAAVRFSLLCKRHHLEQESLVIHEGRPASAAERWTDKTSWFAGMSEPS